MAERSCEAQGCAMPGTVCPACDQCFCWQHLKSSSCEVCRSLVFQKSFEHQLGRLVSIGGSILLLGLFLLFLPRDAGGFILQLAILLIIGGFLLLWLGLLASV